MTRTSTFVVATLAAIAAASFATTAASARGGGHAAAGGFSAPAHAYAPVARGTGQFSNYAGLPGAGKSRFPSIQKVAQLPPHHITVNNPPSNTSKPSHWHGYAAGGVGFYGDDCLTRQYLPNGRVVLVNVCSQDM